VESSKWFNYIIHFKEILLLAQKYVQGYFREDS
jgi:hypothetical protein